MNADSIASFPLYLSYSFFLYNPFPGSEICFFPPPVKDDKDFQWDID